MRITIEVPVRPTEDAARVIQAVANLFPDSRPALHHDRVHAATDNITTLLKKAGEERIMDAARGALWRGRLDSKSTRFELNKQAAVMGRVNFNEITHPLGDLAVTIHTDSLEALLDRISPPTPAEVAHREGNAHKRAEMHQEEQTLEAIATDIDSGLDELDAQLDAEEEAQVDTADDASQDRSTEAH